jgi:4-amino-4-deoxy-L-arabinose transferase-like glycosyltransferase
MRRETMPNAQNSPSLSVSAWNTNRQRILIISLIFLTALGVRLLVWQNQRAEVGQVQTRVAENYKLLARLLVENGFSTFFDASSTTSNPDLLGHPPGYSIVLALIYRLTGESDAAAQLFQILCDSLCAVIIFLIAIELLPPGVGTIAGFMAAFAPQFSWNSILLLPDMLAALPILLGLYLIIRGSKRPCLVIIFGAGAFLGVSCWLRANTLLLAPFLTLLVPFVFPPGARLKMALTLVAGAFLILAPLTIRNAVVFGRFIPVSLGAGQTLLEGIADYDNEGRFGVPTTDMELIRQEAEVHNRPDYATTLFGPDAIQRDRERLARGFEIIRGHPIWFFTVVVRRATNMWRLERVPLISTGNLPCGGTRFLYLAVRVIQRLFITAVVLPLVLAGLIVLGLRRQFRVIATLLATPVYYFCTQSALHTEYRYVLVIHHFLFVVAGVAIYSLGCQVGQRFSFEKRSTK